VGGGDGVEKVDGCVPHGMVAVDVEELAAGAVEVVEGRLVGIDGGAADTNKVPVRRRRKTRGRLRRDNIVYSRGERKEYRP
jgi:hypothetical protein